MARLGLLKITMNFSIFETQNEAYSRFNLAHTKTCLVICIFTIYTCIIKWLARMKSKLARSREAHLIMVPRCCKGICSDVHSRRTKMPVVQLVQMVTSAISQRLPHSSQTISLHLLFLVCKHTPSISIT